MKGRSHLTAGKGEHFAGNGLFRTKRFSVGEGRSASGREAFFQRSASVWSFRFPMAGKRGRFVSRAWKNRSASFVSSFPRSLFQPSASVETSGRAEALQSDGGNREALSAGWRCNGEQSGKRSASLGSVVCLANESPGRRRGEALPPKPLAAAGHRRKPASVPASAGRPGGSGSD